MQTVNQNRRLSFFGVMGIVGLLAVHIGFAKTFIVPQIHGEFAAPIIISVHGSLAVSWVTLFTIQSLLTGWGKPAAHRALGILGFLVATGAAVTMLPAGMYQVRRDLAAGMGDTAVSSLVGVVTAAVMFLGFVAAGMLTRSRSAMHKRFMLLALIVLLWPAWFRFRHYFPGVPRPDIWFAVVLADSLIGVAWLWDWRTHHRIHPVLLYGGCFIILEHTLEVLAFDSAPWRHVAAWLFGSL
ncbi:hypothetical protein [Chitinophaga sp.]|uniref:hypothetical protein n=1 Tax=Chitinophaga sp. TaxID=1869181 RepID=UPI00261EAC93|nr:hypothetical protein [uncultured Chitinophaga sp.]